MSDGESESASEVLQIDDKAASSPVGRICPVCEREPVTAMRPNNIGIPEFKPAEPVDMCVSGAWIIIHEADVKVDVLEHWRIDFDLSTVDEYALYLTGEDNAE